jgi:hypothetical protein
MRTLVNAAGLIFLSTAFASLLPAQWPAFKTPRVPRTATGEPDLNAPAPRTPDGKIDFSGVWQMPRGGGAGPARGNPGGGGAAPRGARGDAAPARGGAGAQRGGGGARGGQAAQPAGPPLASFANVGAGIPEGLPMQPWAQELVRKRMADNSKDNPDAHCLPMGFMQFHTHPEPRKIIQTPEVTMIVYEANSGLRQIFTDGRPLPGKDAEPWWYGYSIGKWDGDTFVVETIGFLDRDPQWLDIRGSPLTEAAKVTEKFRRPNFGTLEIEVTVDDPKAYTKPWTVLVRHRIMVDTDLIEFICEERDATHYVGADGGKK